MSSTFCIGIDFSGGKIKDAAIAHRGALRARCRPPVPADEHRGAIAAIIARVAASEPEIGGAAAVGMSATEAISPAAGPSNNADSTYLRGGAPQQDLPSALGRRARLAKTASCFALSQVPDNPRQNTAAYSASFSPARLRRRQLPR